MPARPDIVVTGLGAVSALGLDANALADALARGRHGIGEIARYDTSELAVHLAALVPWTEPIPDGWTLGELFAVRAAKEAWAHAELDGVKRDRIALVLGTMGELRGDVGATADRVAAELGIEGPRLTVSTACTSSANAIGLARDLIEAGWADIAIAGGADELEKALLAGFAALGVLSEVPCAPFSTPAGTTLGEGAAFVVLERHGRRRPIASILGYGLSSDAYDETTPDPRGGGVARAMRAALQDAELEPGSIEYVNAHGTGTEHNDVAEWRAVLDVFGAEAPPKISATKSQLGHAQGAAGALELAATLLAREREMFLPTLRFVGPRARGPSDPIASDRPRPGRYDRALSASSAFGGANCSIVIGSPRERETRRRSVFWLAHASAGIATDELVSPSARIVDGADLRRVAPHVDPRGLDPSTLALIAASAQALEASGVSLRGALRDRAGILLGSTRIARESLFRYQESIRQRGFAHVCTNAFARVIPHAPAASATIAFSLRGPASTVHTGASSGLAALAHAAELLATRGDVELLLAAGADEAHTPESGTTGAACAVLSQKPQPGAVRVAGWAIAASPSEARARALAGAGIETAETSFDEQDLSDTLALSPALGSITLALLAAESVKRGAKSALACARGRGTSAAVVLTED